MNESPTCGAPPQSPRMRPDLVDRILPLAVAWRSVFLVPILAGAAAWAVTFAVRPVYVATTTFLPPQQQQSVAASALSSLGALAGIGAGGIKSPAQQFISLMQSANVTDRLIDRYKLIGVYDVHYRDDAQRELDKHTAFRLGKKDGLITIDVEDVDPKRAAAIANDYVSELRRVTSDLAISEAQQRRVFFEREMLQVKAKLVDAQKALEGSGFNEGALKAEPKAAADTYANLRAQLTSAQIKLQMMRSLMSEPNPEVVQQKAVVQGLQAKADALEESAAPAGSQPADYVARYREFKYQEALFDQMARQYELARVDEAREGALVQVVDPARVPEHRSRPRRLRIALVAAFLAAILYPAFVLARDGLRRVSADERTAERWRQLRRAMRR